MSESDDDKSPEEGADGIHNFQRRAQQYFAGRLPQVDPRTWLEIQTEPEVDDALMAKVEQVLAGTQTPDGLLVWYLSKTVDDGREDSPRHQDWQERFLGSIDTTESLEEVADDDV